jgi:hypothetical protein
LILPELQAISSLLKTLIESIISNSGRFQLIDASIFSTLFSHKIDNFSHLIPNLFALDVSCQIVSSQDT